MSHLAKQSNFHPTTQTFICSLTRGRAIVSVIIHACVCTKTKVVFITQLFINLENEINANSSGENKGALA